MLYSRALGIRSPGTHNLCLLEDADHNFTHPGVWSSSYATLKQLMDLFQNRETVVETILNWYDAVQKEECKTGVWETGVRPKL